MTTTPTGDDIDTDDTLTGEPDDDHGDDTLVDEDADNDAPALTSRSAETDPAPSSGRGRRRLELAHAPVSTHSGQALTADEASAVMAQYPVDLIVAVAEAEAGKTTLFASIYEQIARAPLAGWAFESSLSLLGFEARSFDATHESGHGEEKTQRTSQNTRRIALHLAVRDADCNRRHLLFGDVSGEHARTLIEFNDPVDYRPLLRSATRVLVLVDGEKLLTPAAQNATLTRTRTLIRALAEGDDIPPGVPLDLVVTKWDKCGQAEGLSPELDRLLAFAQYLWLPTALHRTAARPAGEGVPELFAVLLTPRAARPPRAWTAPQLTRELHRFAPHSGIAGRFVASGGRRLP
ncbi:MAG: hypothetical protein JWM02_1316 [Frankiales bacterium]|nr:hypothetical protein [Frankiales bacterium]